MVDVEVWVEDRGFGKTLQKWVKHWKDTRPIMHDVAILLRREVDRNFEAEGRDETGATHTWKQLSQRTQKMRAEKKGKAYAAHPILEFTGRLKQSFNIAWGKDYAKVYTGVQYGVWHQIGARNLPKRPFMVLTKQGKKQIIERVRPK